MLLGLVAIALSLAGAVCAFFVWDVVAGDPSPESGSPGVLRTPDSAVHVSPVVNITVGTEVAGTAVEQQVEAGGRPAKSHRGEQCSQRLAAKPRT